MDASSLSTGRVKVDIGINSTFTKGVTTNNSIFFPIQYYYLVSYEALSLTSINNTFREVYHTKRMQIVQSVKWSLDNKYILSGSAEMNIRVWKAKASEKLGVVSS